MKYIYSILLSLLLIVVSCKKESYEGVYFLSEKSKKNCAKTLSISKINGHRYTIHENKYNHEDGSECFCVYIYDNGKFRRTDFTMMVHYYYNSKNKILRNYFGNCFYKKK